MAHNPALGSGGEPGPTRVRVVAADALVAEVLRAALSQVPGFVVAAGAEPAHVVLWDAGFEAPARGVELRSGSRRSERRGLEAELRAALQAPAQGPALPVVALARDDAHAAQLSGHGQVQGILPRQAAPQRLAAALLAVRYGLWVVDGALGPALWPAAQEPTGSEEHGLTAREREVLGLVALGLSNKRIARRLELSVHTVKFHMNGLLAKLGADSRAGAVAAAVRRGLLNL